MALDGFKNFDWRSLKKYTDPQAANKLNDFIEALPQNTGQTLLVITGVIWTGAAAAGLFTTVQLKSLTELRAEVQEMKAIKPAVPEIKDSAVNSDTIKKFVDQTKNIYTGLNIRADGPKITITAGTTAQFGEFREAIGHIQNGGSGWRVNVDKLCVGRECTGNPLSATLKINKVSVEQSK